jgi:general secretion pathway protein N
MRARGSVSLMLALGGVVSICASAVQAAVGLAVDPLQRVPAAVEPSPAPGATAGAASNAPVGNPLWAVPLSALSATRDRPIFSPSRRPPPPPVIAAPAASPPKPTPPPEADRPPLVLLGTVIGESRRIGVFLEEPTKKLIRLEPGEGHSGWLLRRVDRREVQFEKLHRAATLVLRAPPGPEPVTGSVGVPAREPVLAARHRKR